MQKKKINIHTIWVKKKGHVAIDSHEMSDPVFWE